MPNTYVNLGQEIGNILGRATAGSPEKAKGYMAGADAGSMFGLRSAQRGQSLADTERILYELDQARRGDTMTATDLATAMGVPPEMAEALAAGRPSIEGERAPEVDVGPMPAEAIPDTMKDIFTNASTVRALQQLTGGTTSGANAQTLMQALSGGQDLGMRYDMMSGERAPTDIAEMQAAMEGKYPGTGGGGSTATKVQEVNYLMGQGMSFTDSVKQVYGGDKAPASRVQEVEHLMSLGIPQEVAIDAVHGNPKAKTYADVYAKVFAQTFSVSQAQKAAQNAADQYKSGYEQDTGAPTDDPLGIRGLQ